MIPKGLFRWILSNTLKLIFNFDESVIKSLYNPLFQVKKKIILFMGILVSFDPSVGELAYLCYFFALRALLKSCMAHPV